MIPLIAWEQSEHESALFVNPLIFATMIPVGGKLTEAWSHFYVANDAHRGAIS